MFLLDSPDGAETGEAVESTCWVSVPKQMENTDGSTSEIVTKIWQGGKR